MRNFTTLDFIRDGIPQAAADALNVHPTTISRWRSGQTDPSPEHALMLAEFICKEAVAIIAERQSGRDGRKPEVRQEHVAPEPACFASTEPYRAPEVRPRDVVFDPTPAARPLFAIPASMNYVAARW